MGAPESNAGDDFHFWWAAGRALALIDPGTNSRLLVIEGLAPIDDPEDQYDVADVTEYFGGVDFASATKVLISQLKYSTRHPNRPWTAAQLVRKRSRLQGANSNRTTRSVVKDLAKTYGMLIRDFDRNDVMTKVRIRLVSNQPTDQLLLKSVTAAAEWVQAAGPDATRAAMLRALPDGESAIINQLFTAIGQTLSSADTCDFLSVLDLSENQALDRAALARGVRAGTAKILPGRGPDSSQRLFDLVRRQALPESRRRGLTADDVLAGLDVADVLDLYPAPSRFATLPDPLPAPGARALGEAAQAHLGAVVVAHGPAGAGKTTAIRQMSEYLPEGSEVLVYDCYGAGEYLSAGEERHTPPRFVMQIANDLAQQCGTPLLLDTPTQDADLWRNLSRRLSWAANTLPPDAILVLAVDAADNSAVAAKERGEASFLTKLLALPLPPKVAVVLTARSHRIDLTDAGTAPRVAIVQFDPATSAAHLRRHRPQATDADAAGFHQRTGGNPRVQFYVLEQATSSDWDMPALLAACNRTPEPLFGDIVNSALQSSGTGAGGQRWLALMLALARPISLDTLADALNVETRAVTAFADGLTPGVEIVDGAIQFRDEDFETYVRDQVDPADVVVAHSRLADLFLASRNHDADAAAHVAEHLNAALRQDELLSLVLEEDSPRGIQDGFRREHVQGRRLDLAARAAADINLPATAVRIAARGCDTASRIDTLSRLVESHLDLVTRYADVDLLRAYALKQSRSTWLGPVQMRLAAALSRDPDRKVAAREALESAEAWVRRWMAGREDDTSHWGLEPDEVAGAAEAYFRLDGPDAAIAWLRRWRPASFAAESTVAFAARIASDIGPEATRAALEAGGVPAVVHAPFLAYAASPTARPDRNWVNRVVAALTATSSRASEPWQARLLAVAVRYGSTTDAEALALHWKRSLPASAWQFRSPDADGVTILRCHAVAAALTGTELNIDALIPASLQPTQENGYPHDPRGRERAEWLTTVGPIGRIALLAAQATASHAVRDVVDQEVARELASRLDLAGHRWFKHDTSFRAWASLAADALLDANAPTGLFDKISDAAPKLMRDDAPELWLDLAETLGTRPQHADRSADLCLRAAATVRSGAYPAPDRLNLLARAADIAGRIMPAVGRQLFEYAVDAATGINDDAARLLAVHADLARRAAFSQDQRTDVATRLIHAAEDVAPHVTETDVVPWTAIAGAASYLDAAVGLAAVCRWDDEARVTMATTFSTALLSVVEGDAVSAAEALALDHLIEDNGDRLDYQLALILKMPTGDVGATATRRATARATSWLRLHVPAVLQPALAQRLLKGVFDYNLTAAVRAELEALHELALTEHPRERSVWNNHDGDGESAEVQTLLKQPESRSWKTLAEDVALLEGAYLYGERMRSFVVDVLHGTPTSQRTEALAALAKMSGWRSTDIVLPVLADLVQRWHEWPGVREWAATALPGLLAEHLPSLVAWPIDVGPLTTRLRTLADDDDIRRAVLNALPDCRSELTAQGWQNIAAILGRLCPSADAAAALVGLLDDYADGAPERPNRSRPANSDLQPLTMLLWSVFGHPRREVRWRAAHAVRDLLTFADGVNASDTTAQLMRCMDLGDVGQFRDPHLHFYRLSALTGLLTALARVAADKPALLVPHLQTLTQVATSSELPHAQIRELARAAVLTVLANDASFNDLQFANRPTACDIDRTYRYGNERYLSDDRRYRFDTMDTIPYWYTPLARVFGLQADDIAKRAERWILDKWSRSEDDWMTDPRELRDERSYRRMHNDHGSIPPVESFRLYLEYHAMLVSAGELIDEHTPVHVDNWADAPDPWRDWLEQHLPYRTEMWLADLRSPVPTERELFGHLSPLDDWDIAGLSDYERALGLVAGALPKKVVVAGITNVNRSGAYGHTYIASALVSPENASDLQRALAAASNPTDYRLPDEEDESFEVGHGSFTLRAWLTGAHFKPEGLEQHDPYAYDMCSSLTLPGRQFRDATGSKPDRTGLGLIASSSALLARVEQWADPASEDSQATTSSGHQVRVDQATLLAHLRETNTNLILEVQIGRHRSNRGSDEYRPPNSRLYLIEATGRISGC